MPVQAVDLFCGVGGLTHGVTQAGIPVVVGIDNDPTCEFAYTHNNGAFFVLGDVSTYPSENITNFFAQGSIKVLMGCAPCQPFSKLQKNEQDKSKKSKWGLLYSFLEHIRKVNPEIVSMENVPALRSEVVFNDFVHELEDMGYHVSYCVVDASNYGVPQRRKRLLLLASRLGNINLIEPTHRNNKITVQMAIGNLPIIENGQTHQYDLLHRAARLSEINLNRIRASVPGGTWHDWNYSLLPECYKRQTGQSYRSVYGRMRYDDVAPTLTTQFNKYGTGRYGHPVQDRALSLREGAILQSFPSNYQFVETENYNLADIARQIGNAVPVRLGEVIGLSILEHLRGLGYDE